MINSYVEEVSEAYKTLCPQPRTAEAGAILVLAAAINRLAQAAEERNAVSRDLAGSAANLADSNNRLVDNLEGR